MKSRTFFASLLIVFCVMTSMAQASFPLLPVRRARLSNNRAAARQVVALNRHRAAFVSPVVVSPVVSPFVVQPFVTPCVQPFTVPVVPSQSVLQFNSGGSCSHLFLSR